MLLGRGMAVAAIALTPVPGGRAAAASGFRRSRSNRDLLRLAVRSGPVLPSLFRRAFANAVSAAESEQLFRRRFLLPGLADQPGPVKLESLAGRAAPPGRPG
jgi:hypothetical protein